MKNPYWDGKVHKRAKFGDIALRAPSKNSKRNCRVNNLAAARRKRQ
jgi:hypothetical protein